MNLVLLEPDDFIDDHRVRLKERRLKHIREVHGAMTGRELRVGVINGRIGRGTIEHIDDSILEMNIHLEEDPPAPLPLRLVIALPRPKVFDRIIASATSMGIRQIDVINAWRVDKAYWSSPRLSQENLRLQCVLGLEQSGDTQIPAIRFHPLFTPFVRRELPGLLQESLAILAHPEGEIEAPRNVQRSTILVIGPEGGFIQGEVDAFREIGFHSVHIGPRILRVETALAYLVGRLF